jgi:sRNA-binding regulator protein Hfq
MSKTIKITILAISFSIICLFYIFSHKFRKNKFKIPIFYTNGVNIKGCKKTEGQHIVQFENYNLLEVQLFFFHNWINKAEFYQQCKRIQAKHPTIKFTAIADSTIQSELGSVLLVMDKKQLYKIANCALVVGKKSIIHSPVYNQLVLVDKQKRIRGYYKGDDLEDMNRLDIELHVLNKEYGVKN